MRGRAELPVRPAARVGSDGPGLRLSRRESWSAGRGRRGSVRAVAVRGWREGVGPLPRRDVHFALEMCVLHSRMTVGTALSSAKCTSRRPGAPRGDGPPGARGGAVCPNLLQMPGSSRSAEGYSGVVLKAWGMKVAVAVCSGGSFSSGGLLRRRPSTSSCFTSTAHPAWWDGVSHVVTRPGSRARHSTREIVP